MIAPEIRAQIEEELRRAEAARAAGNEGRARVCARRAAGAALRSNVQRSGGVAKSSSAVDALRAARESQGLTERAREAADRLLVKVGEDFNLPYPWDLIAEARALIVELAEAE